VDISTWNDYLWSLKLFFTSLHHKKIIDINGREVKPEDEWKTPSFLAVNREKEDLEMGDYGELLIVVKCEPHAPATRQR
jgi:hypothetical protein